MILRRYGTSFQSVEMNFDANALNEVGFRRDHGLALTAEEFESTYSRVAEHALESRDEGDVHGRVEQRALDALAAHVEELAATLGEREVLVIENEQGVDWPKTRQQTTNVVVDGENRLHFTVRIDPPLRLGVYRAGDSS